ncbi:hypothetical protein Plec18167_007177 [Paecilomyces lecythidis]|uniref:Uncharacterized protein n=1 Tax=Paecilomyces lecythidis TaxID=3004212 RepID=A0ABR3X6D7_9EURO
MEERQEHDEFTQNSAHKEREQRPSREKMGVVCALGDGRCRRGVGPAARPESARQSDESDTGHESTAQQGTECSDGDEPCDETSSRHPQNGSVTQFFALGSGVSDKTGFWREI